MLNLVLVAICVMAYIGVDYAGKLYTYEGRIIEA